jgi:[protein-PII] uridylyltransferase
VVSAASSSLRELRAQVLRDRELTGTAWCRRYAALTGEWLTGVFAQASGNDSKGLALLAVGGYGRAMLAPGSDLDLLLVYEGRRSVKAAADALWYPIWDAGMPLDHSVRTPREIRSTMDSDIKVALGLLDARLVAGDRKLADAVLTRAAEQWKTRTGKWLPVLARVTRERHSRFGDLAFLLEPDVKEARGGLRDLQLLRSIGRVVPVLSHLLDDPGLAHADETLTSARVELQRPTAQATNILLLQDQDAVAARLAFEDADSLMAAVADAGRTISWASDDGWRRLESWLAGPRGRAAGRDRSIEPGLVVRDGEVVLPADADPAEDTSLALRAAAASAELDVPMARSTLDRLAESATAPSGVWPPETLHAFLRLLGAGRPAIAAVESLDQKGIWLRYLPEWAPVRNRPQRNAFHRYTVDRHLLETAAGAAAHQSSVARPDLLLLGALFHDIGKGRGGDHTDAGITVIRELGPRLGLDPDDAAELEQLVRHHLLLPDAATRRDLDDPSTASAVATAVGNRQTLDLLALLTEVDSIATGPAAWSPWKASLVARLVDQVAHTLEGRPPTDGRDLELPPEQLALLASGRLELLVDGGRLSIAAPDRPGLLSVAAGVLTLAGIVVRAATTVSDPDTGMALLQFDVTPAFDDLPNWATVRLDLDAALEGRLPVDRLLAERESRYARFRRSTTARLPEVVVLIDNELSETSTVIEVRAPDRGPVLYQVTRALADSGVTITRALVSTLGAEAIDVFYVQTTDGGRVTDPAHQTDIRRSVLAAL